MVWCLLLGDVEVYREIIKTFRIVRILWVFAGVSVERGFHSIIMPGYFSKHNGKGLSRIGRLSEHYMYLEQWSTCSIFLSLVVHS